jgi:hypothetical protein
MAQNAESRIRLEVIVLLINLNSVLVGSFSDMKMRVPSDLTTRSRGEMSSANGNAIHSMIRKAMYVSGVTPPFAPLMWFLERLEFVSPLLLIKSVTIHLLDSTSD